MILTPNESAFLAVIRHSEGTGRYPNPWAVTFGGEFTITDFSDHPHALGWSGYPYRGIMETAAGAYQINYPTWLDGQKALNLPDFSRASQDAFALWLIDARGHALDLVNTGSFAQVVQNCSKIWASLPGSTSGQPQAKLADLEALYSSAGGSLA